MVSHCVQELTLGDNTFGETSGFLDFSTFHAILSHLPKLKSLRLATIYGDPLFRNSGIRLDPIPVHLEQLTLEGSIVVVPKVMKMLLSSFASVNCLKLYRMFSIGTVSDNANPGDGLLPAPSKTFALESIHIVAMRYEKLMDWAWYFLPLVDARALRVLRILLPEHHPFEDRHPDVLPRVLAAVGPALREFSYGCLQRTDPAPLDLSVCTELEAVDITVDTPGFNPALSNDQPFTEGNWLAALWTLVNAPPSVRTMGLHLLHNDLTWVLWDDRNHFASDYYPLFRLVNNFASLDWSLLDLAVSRHPRLETMTIRILYTGIPDGKMRSIPDVASSEDIRDDQHLEDILREILTGKCFSSSERRGLLQMQVVHVADLEQIMG